MRSLSSKGDTIIEVLLAIAIVSSVLAGAFVSSNRTLTNARQAQERGEALKYVESQVEQLKGLSTSNSAIFNISSYCLDSTNVSPIQALGKAPTPDAASDDFSSSEYPNACNLGPGGRYHLSIVQTNPIFTVRARWDSADGNERDEVRVIYKVNQ